MSFASLFHRLRWLHAPGCLLALLLQRTPVLRLLAASPGFGLRPDTGDLLKSAFALAALGACDSVAGATTFKAAPVPPATATPASVSAGNAFAIEGASGDAFEISFTVTGAPGTAHSWKVSGALPPGLAVTGGTVTSSGAFVVNGLKLSLAGVPQATGSYTLTLGAYQNNNASGLNASCACRITIAGPSPPAAPAFTTQPLSQTVVAGGSATFTATLTGSPAPTLQWFRGDTPLEGRTAATLVLNNVGPDDAGAYVLVATNASAPGGVPSEPATLAVQVPPVVTSAPAADLEAAVGELLTLSVTATGTPAPVYQWRKGTVDLAGETGPELALGPVTFADAGTYTVAITNAAGARSVSTRLTVAIPPPATLIDPGTLKTGSAVAFDLSGGQPVPAGLSYKATGLPAGLSLDPATGLITGVIKARPGLAKVVTSTLVGARKGPVRTATLAIGAFPAALAGRYEALLETTGAVPLPAGKLALAVTSSGTFTGTLLTDDPAGRALKGSLVLAAGNTSASATLAVARPAPLPAYQLAFTLSSDEPALTASLAPGADAAPFASAADGARLLAIAPAGATGAYTLLLTEPMNLGTVAEFPLGSGQATASLDAKGTLTLAGNHADGAKLTAALPLGADFTARLYLKPYKITGAYLAGPLRFTPRPDAPVRWHVSPADGSGLFWRKPAPATATGNYAEGFGPLALTARLEPWTKPGAATPLAPLLGLDATGDLGLGLAASGLANTGDNPYGLPAALHFDPAKNLFAGVGADPTAFTAKLVPATGALRGSFLLKAIPPVAQRKVTFTGVALQPAPADLPGLCGGGFFLLPPATKGDPVLSGEVVFSIP